MSTVLDLPHTIRDMKRYVEILGVLVRHGFGDFVQTMNLERLLERGATLVGVSPSPTAVQLTRPARLRKVMEELGPTFIKLGQLLSTRPDLVPPEWADEFKLLQNTCTACPFSEIDQRLQAEFGERRHALFEFIDTVPLATASIAQVHRARLKGGTALLLKIVRPGSEEIIESDFSILSSLAELTEQRFASLGYSPIEVVSTFQRSIKRELDLEHEGRSTERFSAMFEGDSGVVFPRIFWEATTKSVLGVEEMKGVLLSRVVPGDLTAEERRSIVSNGARAVFRQCLEVGFFHADPHPGNLIALPEGRIAFIDCGMTGQMDSETLHLLGDLAVGIVHGDVGKVSRVVGALSDAGPTKVDERVFRTDVREFVSHFENTPLSSLNMGEVLREFFAKIRSHKLRCPADLVLLIKALTTIETAAKNLDPDFDIIAFAEPYVQDLVRRRYSFASITGRTQQAMLDYADLVEKLPYDVGQLLKQVRRNELGFKVEHHGLSRLTESVEHASRNISFALIVAALLVSSSILVLADRGNSGLGLTTIGLVGFGVACVVLGLRIITNRRSKR